MEHENLPVILPLVPLEQPLLLPGTVVPYLTSEPGQRNLVEDALAADRYIAIVQPLEAVTGGPALGSVVPVYSVGCLGYIGEYHEPEEDQYLVLAGGIIRFRVMGDLPSDRGYRRVVVSYGEFLNDPEQVERERLHFPVLKELVRQRIEANEAGIDLSIMDHMAGTEIVTAIAHAIPLSAAERQVLMETPDLQELEGVLLQLMTGPGGLPSFDFPMSAPS